MKKKNWQKSQKCFYSSKYPLSYTVKLPLSSILEVVSGGLESRHEVGVGPEPEVVSQTTLSPPLVRFSCPKFSILPFSESSSRRVA